MRLLGHSHLVHMFSLSEKPSGFLHHDYIIDSIIETSDYDIKNVIVMGVLVYSNETCRLGNCVAAKGKWNSFEQGYQM